MSCSPCTGSNRSICLQTWDRDFAAARNAETYEKLYEQISSCAKASPDDVEIWWRFSRVTFQNSLNLLDEALIKAKTIEAYGYGEKAIAINPNHFHANVWLANAAGKLALLENDVTLKIRYISSFLKHLSVCVRTNPHDHMVLFLEGRLQLAMFMLTDEEKKAIQQFSTDLPLPIVDATEAEAKLRKAIELNPNYIDSYITLAYMLVKFKKYDDAREVAERGLKVERLTKSDEVIAQELEKIKSSLPPSQQTPK